MRKRKLTFGLFSLMMAASVALTANKKGKFKVKVPKVKAGKKYTVKSYKKKKLYANFTIC